MRPRQDSSLPILLKSCENSRKHGTHAPIVAAILGVGAPSRGKSGPALDAPMAEGLHGQPVGADGRGMVSGNGHAQLPSSGVTWRRGR
jgi:hypothetical protein